MLGLNARAVGLLALTSLFECALAQTQTQTMFTANFQYPPAPSGTVGPIIMNVVDTLVVEYTSNIKNPLLWVWCETETGVSRWANLTGPTNGKISFSPFRDSDISRKWDKAYGCHMDLMYANKDLNNVNGPTFSVTSVGSAQATTRERTVTMTNRPPSGSPSISTLPATTTATSTPTNAAPTLPPQPVDNGLSTGAKAGIAVGSIAAVAALLLLGFLVWRNKKKVDKLQSRLPDDNYDQYSKPQGVAVAQPYQDEVSELAYAPPTTKYAMEANQAQPTHRGTAAAPVELENMTAPAPQELPGSSTETRRPF